jgi:hypothetical protein
LLAHEDLARVFSWQEERRLTNNLTLHYKRVLYVVESTPASEKARRKLVGVREDEDGSVHIEYRGAELKARAFPKDSRVRQGAVVENKLLAHTLQVIGLAQRKRDEDKLAAGKMTLRDEDLLRKAMGQAGGLPTRRAEAHQAHARAAKSSTAARMSESHHWRKCSRGPSSRCMTDAARVCPLLSPRPGGPRRPCERSKFSLHPAESGAPSWDTTSSLRAPVLPRSAPRVRVEHQGELALRPS